MMLSFQGDVLGTTSVKPRIKRALTAQQSSKLSVKQLSLELGEKNVSLAITKGFSLKGITIFKPKVI